MFSEHKSPCYWVQQCLPYVTWTRSAIVLSRNVTSHRSIVFAFRNGIGSKKEATTWNSFFLHNLTECQPSLDSIYKNNIGIYVNLRSKFRESTILQRLRSGTAHCHWWKDFTQCMHCTIVEYFTGKVPSYSTVPNSR
jgi:hypothetical protein